MIVADVQEIERLTDLLFSAASETEDVLLRLRRTAAELQDDPALRQYPQYPAAAEAVSLGIDALHRGNETLQSLKNVLLFAAAEYAENEQKHKEALSAMTARLSAIGRNFHAAATRGETACMLRDAQTDRVAQAAAPVLEPQVAVIAAITDRVAEEYGSCEIEAMPPAPEGET